MWYFQDGQGSVLFRQDTYPNQMGPKDSIHYYRDGGFTRRDLGILVKGYQEAWSSFIRPDGSYRWVLYKNQNIISNLKFYVEFRM